MEQSIPDRNNITYSILKGFNLCSMVMRINVINISSFFFKSNSSLFLTLMVILILGAEFSNFLIMETMAHSKAKSYLELMSSIFPPSLVYSSVIILQLCRVMFSFNHIYSLASLYRFKSFSLTPFFSIILFIPIILRNRYQRFSFLLPVFSLLLTASLIFSECWKQEGLIKPVILDSFIVNRKSIMKTLPNISVVFLWISSHHDIRSQFINLNTSTGRALSALFGALFTVFFYTGIGYFGLVAYPSTKNFWIFNMENSRENFLVFLFVLTSIFRLPGLIGGLTKNILVLFNAENYESDLYTVISYCLIIFVAEFIAKTYSNLSFIKTLILIDAFTLMFVFPMLAIYKKSNYSINTKYRFLLLGMVNGFLIISLLVWIMRG